MILLLIASLTLATTKPVAIAHDGAAPTQFAGLIGKKKRWVEIPQEVQYEGDYAPTVGRRAEPTPTAFVPVRYLTPEERAQPIIVDPAPRLVYVDEQKSDEKSSPDASSDKDQSTSGDAPAGASSDNPPSYITSTPTPEAPKVEGLAPAGSATGSKAVPNYGSVAG